MTAPKSFEWRGYVCRWSPRDYHPHNGAEMGECFIIERPRWKGDTRPEWIGIADDAAGAKKQVVTHVRGRLAQPVPGVQGGSSCSQA